MPTSGACCPGSADGLYPFSAPKHFDACRSGTIEDAVDSSAAEAMGSVETLYVNWGRLSTYQLTRFPADVAWANRRLPDFAVQVVGQ